MSYSPVDWSVRPASEAPADERADFIRKTYLHLGGAVLAFAALCAILVNSPIAPAMLRWIGTNQFAWLFVLGAFMGVGWMASKWAMPGQSVKKQYIGLGLYVVAEAFIFVPLLYIAAFYAGDKNLIASAGLITLTVFGGLTATVFMNKLALDSWGRYLGIAGFGALGLIIVSIAFGFSLGTWFSFFMVVLAAGYIMYQTSMIMNRYPVGSHVAASLALFASVALLFYYVLRILLAFASDD